MMQPDTRNVDLPVTAPLVTLADVRAAAERIFGHVADTPFLLSETLSQLTGAELWLKFENLQFTGSFKQRGALNTLLLGALIWATLPETLRTAPLYRGFSAELAGRPELSVRS